MIIKKEKIIKNRDKILSLQDLTVIKLNTDTNFILILKNRQSEHCIYWDWCFLHVLIWKSHSKIVWPKVQA